MIVRVSPSTSTPVVVVTPQCCHVVTKEGSSFHSTSFGGGSSNIYERYYYWALEAPFDLTLQKEIDLVQHMSIQRKTVEVPFTPYLTKS